MEKQKKLITLTGKQLEMLYAIMKRDGTDSVSVAIGYLIKEEAERCGIKILPTIE